MTQAVLPALRRARGRIVNVSSIGGRIALPLVGPYAASKFALEAVSDSLRREVRQFGVDVILIEPGGVKTPIWKKGSALADEMPADMPPRGAAVREHDVRAPRGRCEDRREDGLEPREVAKVIGMAMTKPPRPLPGGPRGEGRRRSWRSGLPARADGPPDRMQLR